MAERKNDPLVTAENLTKYYGKTLALENLSLNLSRGEILGILGANGAGKTTTLHILMGLLLPSSGEVKVLEQDPFKNHHAISKRINFSSAYGNLPSNLKVIENLKIFARLYQIPNPQGKISDLLELFEIDRLKDRISGALSSGENTRLNLVKCLLNDPELLILDEPTASLDPEIADKVRTVLKKIQKERNLGIIYTSHNMFEVEALCDRMIFIHEGRTIVEGTSDEVRKALSASSLEQAFIKIVRGGEIISKDPT